MEFHCWGISHKSTSLEVREKFAFNKDKIDEILAKLKTFTAFDNGIFLSTCNRTEFYSFCPRIEIKKFDSHLEHILGKGLEVRKNDQYLFSDSDAFAHLLRVMTGIDSMIVGEPDIFGQVKKAYAKKLKKTSPEDSPDEFKELELIAKSKGFLLVSSSPLTRSSYHADKDFAKLKKNRLRLN